MKRELIIARGRICLGEDCLKSDQSRFRPESFATWRASSTLESPHSRVRFGTVRLMHQSGSTAYFAMVGGRFEPSLGQSFVAHVGWTTRQGGLSQDIAEEILEGIKSLAIREPGSLTVDHGLVNLVDSFHWAWRRAGATLVRILQNDVQEMSDEHAQEVAEVISWE